jgi:non-heme chloroperoxidase
MNRRQVLRSIASAAAGAGLINVNVASAFSRKPKSSGVQAKSVAEPFVVARDGTRLFYYDWGTGAPVVFIHAWALGADVWEYQTSALSGQGLRCIAYDQRGCGQSGKPSRGYDMDTLADDLAALIDQTDLRKVTLVTHSMGSGVAARYLSRHGSRRVGKVVFVATIAPFILKTDSNPDGTDRRALDGFLAAITKDRARWLTAGAPAFFGAGLPGCDVSPELSQWVVNLALRTPMTVMIDTYRSFTETDFRADLQAVKLPVLIIHGDHDTSAPLEQTGRKVAGLIAGSRLVIYENASHGLFITHMDRLNEDLLEFIRS